VRAGGYDPAGNMTSVTQDGTQVAAYTYEAQGRMLTSTDSILRVRLRFRRTDGLAQVRRGGGRSSRVLHHVIKRQAAVRAI
jgi:YD repeat-containing protein